MEYFDLLPEEITLEIISRLPTESILECNAVCTDWRSLVRRPSFSKMHLYHLNHHDDSGKLGFIGFTYSGKLNFQYFEYNENHESIERIRRLNIDSPFGLGTIFLGSSNGLICLYKSRYYLPGKTYICNPITREYLMLPDINTVAMVRAWNGFGYVSSTKEYKLVTITFEKETEFVEVFIYTLGSGNVWRSIGKFDLGTGEHWGDGVYFHGALYWLDYESEMIVSFDLVEEKFCEHLAPPPSPPEYEFDDSCKLWVLDGCLSFAIYRIVNEAECWDVWLLKNKDDNHGMKHLEGHQSLGWSKVFRVFDREFFAVTKSYTVLTYKGNHINVHDLEASTSKTIMDFKESFDEVFCHKNTLVSLKELGEEDTKIMQTENHDLPFSQL